MNQITIASSELPISHFRKLILYSSVWARGLAMLGVIGMHTTAASLTLNIPFQTENPAHLAAIIVNSICRFAVPLFFILTGFQLALQGPQRNLTRFYSSKLKFILFPYFIYSVIYHFLLGLLGSHSLSLKNFLFNFFTGGGAAHLWFIHTLILLILIHPYLYTFYCRFVRGNLWIFIALTALRTVWSPLITGLADSSQSTSDSIIVLFFDNEIFNAWWYFLAGYFLHDNAGKIMSRVGKDSSRSGLVVTFFGLVALQSAFWVWGLERYGSIAQFPFNYILLAVIDPLFGVTALLIISSRPKPEGMSGQFWRLIETFGLFSLGVYFLHAAVLAGLRRILGQIGGISFESVWFMPVIFILTAVMTVTTVKILARTPIGKYLT